ncbi:MAG: OmpA family protein [Zoogloeaceae bacterium]|jgi:outer membrane protein OmpA-like peptidoglycan-associated protein|nr:OmpA family protein [Zoogloeaceae bacterium]
MSIARFSRYRAIVCLSLPLCVACDTQPILPTRVETPAVTQAESAASAPAAPQTPSQPAAITTESTAPEAVYMLPMAQNAPLPNEVEQSLKTIAERMKARRDLIIRLESHVPDSGSREMDIGLSRQAAASIQRRLVELGVPSYRVKPSPLGAEYPGATRLKQRRVELFILPLPR